MSEKSPYKDFGFTAQQVLTHNPRKKINLAKGLAVANIRLQVHGKKKRTMNCPVKKCPRLRQDGEMFCYYHNAGVSNVGPRLSWRNRLPLE